MKDYERLRALERPQGKIDVVLDTDTYNEVDDQFALAYMMKAPEKLNVLSITAAPFYNQKSTSPAHGMELSYQEIEKLLTFMDRRDMLEKVYKGSERFLPDEQTLVDSPAARKIVELALHYTAEKPLYVVAIGAITNVASAILMEPAIADKMVLVWLGGHALHYKDNAEFNLRQDIAGARVIWDVTAVAWLLDEDGTMLYDRVMPRPVPEYDNLWGEDPNMPLCKYVYYIRRDLLLRDMVSRLTGEDVR